MAFASNTERALVRAAEENASDALIYADWLDEQGRSDEAELIRELGGNAANEAGFSRGRHGYGDGYSDSDGYGDGYGDGGGYGYGDGDGYGDGYGDGGGDGYGDGGGDGGGDGYGDGGGDG